MSECAEVAESLWTAFRGDLRACLSEVKASDYGEQWKDNVRDALARLHRTNPKGE